MQSSNRLFDDLAKVANGAMSAAAGARQELEQFFQQRMERFLNDHGWVTREEFEAVRDMAQKAREEQDAMAARLTELEAMVAAAKKPAKKTTRKPATRSRKTATPKAE